MSAYLSPARLCDLVMKGGVTSGVVYPPAIDQIARRFYLCGIGGTSAGAIAAAVAAAAELRRRKNDPAGFEMLAKIPAQITAPGNLFSLFVPDRPTKRLYDLLINAQKTGLKGLCRKLRVGADLAWLLFRNGLKPLVDNRMGLCSGMGNGLTPDPDKLAPLTRWLSDQIDDIAGLKGTDRAPLTFGHLWDAPRPPRGLDHAMTGVRESIRLQFISTCLTFGRPYCLPFLGNQFAFVEAEMRQYFPAHVVDYMVEAAAALTDDRGKPLAPLPAPYLRLPVADKLPVIVATRMSLSFPFLFSLVPLHFQEYRDGRLVMKPVYFADGGITSNLPIHFFDSPFPRWPTLAVNLRYADADGNFARPNVSTDGVYLPDSNRGGIHELFNQFYKPQGSAFANVAALVGAIFGSSQNWNDNSFLTLPGYRDRVAEVWLTAKEGGLNLDMPPDVIQTLLQKGDAAGRELANRFAAAPGAAAGMSWDNHRWVRYRANMAALATLAQAFGQSVSHPMPGDDTLHQLIDRANPPSYPFKSAAQRDAARAATEAFIAFAAGLAQHPVCTDDPIDVAQRPFCDGPRPPLDLRVRAPMGPTG